MNPVKEIIIKAISRTPEEIIAELKRRDRRALDNIITQLEFSRRIYSEHVDYLISYLKEYKENEEKRIAEAKVMFEVTSPRLDELRRLAATIPLADAELHRVQVLPLESADFEMDDSVPIDARLDILEHKVEDIEEALGGIT